MTETKPTSRMCILPNKDSRLRLQKYSPKVFFVQLKQKKEMQLLAKLTWEESCLFAVS